MPVELKAELFPRHALHGHRVAHPPRARSGHARTFTVEVKVPNNYGTLRPGMYARTHFDMGRKEGVLVPDVAVQKQVGSAERYLYVIRDGVAERRSVKVRTPDRLRSGHPLGRGARRRRWPSRRCRNSATAWKWK